MKIVREENYDAGRSIESFRFVELGHTDMPALNGPSFLVQAARYKKINSTFATMLQTWRTVRSAEGILGSPIYPSSFEITEEDYLQRTDLHSSGVTEYHFLAETLVHNMRRFLETHLHFIQIKKHQVKTDDRYALPTKIKNDQLSDLLDESKSPETEFCCFYGANQTDEKIRTFVDLLNRLGNAMRHQAMFADSYSHFGADYPTVIGYETPWNALKEAVWHNHNAYHLMMGFQDTSRNVLRHTRQYFDDL